jgi:hypothetical protein
LISTFFKLHHRHTVYTVHGNIEAPSHVYYILYTQYAIVYRYTTYRLLRFYRAKMPHAEDVGGWL